MSRPTQAGPPVLECGRDLLSLAEQVSEGLPPTEPEHQARCPFCQEAITRLRVAFDALHDLAGQTVRAPRGLSSRVLDQLRRERGTVVIATGEGGSDSVSEVIVGQIARHAALGMDAVLHVSVVTDALQDGGLELDVHVTAALGPSLPALVDRLREQVVAHVWALSGARVTRIDVTVDDVV